jgi:hypothetical protein
VSTWGVSGHLRLCPLGSSSFTTRSTSCWRLMETNRGTAQESWLMSAVYTLSSPPSELANFFTRSCPSVPWVPMLLKLKRTFHYQQTFIHRLLVGCRVYWDGGIRRRESGERRVFPGFPSPVSGFLSSFYRSPVLVQLIFISVIGPSSSAFRGLDSI